MSNALWQGRWLDGEKLLPTAFYPVARGAIIGRVSRWDAKPYLLGYVMVPKGHPWHGKSTDYIDKVARVGGLPVEITYSKGKLDVDGYERDDWWIGFSTEHERDPMDPAWTIALVGYLYALVEQAGRETA